MHTPAAGAAVSPQPPCFLRPTRTTMITRIVAENSNVFSESQQTTVLSERIANEPKSSARRLHRPRGVGPKHVVEQLKAVWCCRPWRATDCYSGTPRASATVSSTGRFQCLDIGLPCSPILVNDVAGRKPAFCQKVQTEQSEYVATSLSAACELCRVNNCGGSWRRRRYSD